jgi:anhydro-N-acetylmuramic acid kinase
MADLEPRWALGMMSGTSLDGIDAALLRSDGERIFELGPYLTRPYDAAFREELRDLLGRRQPDTAVVAVETELTRRHAAAAAALLDLAKLKPADIDLIGFHGQTILHEPDRARTWQIGDGALLAHLTGIDVVADFRSQDVAAGGQGAPFAPLYHAALARDLDKPLAVLNIGGVSNVTWIPEDDDKTLAFDCGPGNALMDDWLSRHFGLPFDEGGRVAAQGAIDDARLAHLCDQDYFQLPPPKSLDRNDFEASARDIMAGEDFSPTDGVTTLAAFTAASVALACRHFPQLPKRWLVTGGGRLNAFLMAQLSERLAATVDPVEAVGWNGDALEAQAFAYLAIRSRAGLPLSLPGTTGVPEPLTGGAFFAKDAV